MWASAAVDQNRPGDILLGHFTAARPVHACPGAGIHGDALYPVQAQSCTRLVLGDVAAAVFLVQARDFIGRQEFARIADDDVYAAVIERGVLHANRLGLRRMPVSIAEQLTQGHAQQAGPGLCPVLGAAPPGHPDQPFAPQGRAGHRHDLAHQYRTQCRLPVSCRRASAFLNVSSPPVGGCG